MTPLAPAHLVSTLMLPASWIYGVAVAARNRLYERHLEIRQLPVPVISVGNVTLGGSGKTPLVAWMGRRLLSQGRRVAVLSRGYRRREEAPFVLVSDGERVLADAETAGDEPVELAHSVSGLVVAVGADRYRVGLEVLRRFGKQVLILDDGFQHRRLFRNLDIVCVDASESLHHLRLLPAGRLREPLKSLGRAHALVWTRSRPARPEAPLAARVLRSIGSDIPVFRSSARLARLVRLDRSGESLGPERLDRTPVAAMAAVAQPDRFRADLEASGAHVVCFASRRDHHRWQAEDVRRVMDKARARGAVAVVTTGKDAVKLGFLQASPIPIYRAELETSVVEEDRFDALVEAVLTIPGEPTPERSS